jgi:ribonuclease HII
VSRDRWKPIERELRKTIGPLIAGVDEVGRGPLAGPVVACAAIMPPDVRAIAGVDDSKQLRPLDRERLARKIRERAVAIGIGAASVREIDRLNIYHATILAMRRALGRLATTPHHVLLDGRPMRTLGVEHTAIVHGDDVCYSIACASIIAKVTRDRVMRGLAGRYPNYLWERNVGYSTLAHLQGLAAHGITPHHRHSFLPVRQLSLDFTSGNTELDLEALAKTIGDEHAFESGEFSAEPLESDPSIEPSDISLTGEFGSSLDEGTLPSA